MCFLNKIKNTETLQRAPGARAGIQANTRLFCRLWSYTEFHAACSPLLKGRPPKATCLSTVQL